MTDKRRRILWNCLGLSILIGMLALLASSQAFKNELDAFAGWTIRSAQENPISGSVIFILFSAFSAMLAFASSVVLVPPATQVWGKLATFLFLWTGWTLGAAAAFGIGRLATPLLVRLGYGNKLKKYQQFVSKQMGFGEVLLFCLMVPSEVPGYLFGGAHYSFVKFIGAMAIAESVYAFGLVILGDSLQSMKPSFVLMVSGFLVLTVLVLLYALRWLKNSGRIAM